MNNVNIKDELKRKKRFITFLRNAVVFLVDSIDRNDYEEEIAKYRKNSILAVDAILKINSHGELKNADTREEDVKLEELKKVLKNSSKEKDIARKYEELPDSLIP